MAAIPPLPPGFKLDNVGADMPPLPPGFSLDETKQSPAFEMVPSSDGTRSVLRVNLDAITPSSETVAKTVTPAIRGMSNTLGLPGAAGSMLPGYRGSDLPTKFFASTPMGLALNLMKTAPMPETIKAELFKMTGIPETDASTRAGRIAQGAGEFAAGALTGGATTPTALISAGLGGAGHQIGKEIDPKSKVLPFALSLIGLSIPSLFKYLRPTSSDIVTDSLKNAPMRQVDDAADVQSLANQQRNPVTGPEALNNPTLLRYQRIIEQSPEGAPLRSVMENRAANQSKAAGNVVDDIAPRTSPSVAVDAVQAASKGAIGDLKSARTAAVEPAYTAASMNTIQSKALDPLIANVEQKIKEVGTESQIGKELLSFKSKISSTIRDNPGQIEAGPQAGVGPLDAIYKEIRDRASKPTMEPGAFDNEVRGVLKPLNRQLGDILAAEDPNIAGGRRIYQEMSPPVREMQASPVGKVAEQASPTLKSTTSILLDPTKVRPVEVTKAFTAITKQDKNAAPKLLGAFIETTMDTAQKRLANGPAQNAGGKFYSSVMGTPYAEANMRAAFDTIPNGSEKFAAFKNVLRVFEAQSRRLPVGTDTADKLSSVAKLQGGISPRFIKWFDDMRAELVSGRNRAQLAELFARSDSVDEMARIAKLNPSARESAAQIGKFIALESSLVPAGESK